AGSDGRPDPPGSCPTAPPAAAGSRGGLFLLATLIHPEATGGCGALSAEQGPTPPLGDHDPFARFTPEIDVTPPPLPACAIRGGSASWGPLGPPDELVEVPPEMQAADPDRNLKWRGIARYTSQVECSRRGDRGHPPPRGSLR